MDNLDENCKHGQITRNCYSCYLHRNDNEPVNFQDMIFSTLSELKIRIAKLEQYKLLQDDINKYSHIVIGFCDEHRKKQIDQNVAVSNHLDCHDEDVRYLVKEKIILEKGCAEHNDKLNILLIRMDKLDLAIKLATEYVLFEESDYDDEPKTIGLTFEEAITAFKKGGKIKRERFVDFIHMDKDPFTEAITPRDIFENDWEIVNC